jgi:hypothetical protein
VAACCHTDTRKLREHGHTGTAEVKRQAIQFLAFVKTHGLRPLDDFTNYGAHASRSYEIPAGSFGERKARADEIARSIGATPTWRNGYYVAVRQDAILRTEIHFFPPILAADAEDAA